MSTPNLIVECCDCGWKGTEDQKKVVKDTEYSDLEIYNHLCPECENDDFYHTRKPQDFEPFFMEGFYKIDRDQGNERANNVIDSVLVTYTTDAMTNKLKKAFKQGKSNWWKSSDTTISTLKTFLNDHIAKGEFLDATIFAAMIHARECAEWQEALQGVEVVS